MKQTNKKQKKPEQKTKQNKKKKKASPHEHNGHRTFSIYAVDSMWMDSDEDKN